MGWVWFFWGLAAGFVIARVWPGYDASSPAPQEASTGAGIAEGSATQDAFAVSLHHVDETLNAFGHDAAHVNALAAHPDFRKAVAIFLEPAMPLSTLADYAFGQSWTLSCAAFAALKERADGAALAARVPDQFDAFSAWQMRFALDFLRHSPAKLPVGAPLVGIRDWWLDSVSVQKAFADHFEALGESEVAEFGPDVERLPLAQRQKIRAFLDLIRYPLAERLAANILTVAEQTDDTSSAFLATFGRFWNPHKELGLLIEPDSWKDALSGAANLVLREPVRALLVSGETASGKTAFLRLLSARAAEGGWRVFEASAADLQAGQFYIGQLEGRIHQAIDELHISKRIIWYIPDLLACAMSGTHQGQSASILDQILPALSSGRIVVWTEATPTGIARLLQLRPALRSVLEVVRLDPMSVQEAETLADRLSAALAKDAGASAEKSFATTAVEAAQHYLTASSLPGAALAVMKLTASRLTKDGDNRFAGHDILETLAQMTGLPLSLLDGAERLDLPRIADFFGSRVVGQPEAIASIVERIAMLKSGLNDPGKPIGVFLFAGPTGTGKTELAKTAAEYLFGTPDRMIRLDMSEYQSPESISKILGGGGLALDADTLVARIRKQPFSIVLLDEFEKSNGQIWDLFLQVFDEGRLTDAFGQTADFRHSLIILTTNLGATTHRGSGSSLGFKPSLEVFTSDQILRAIGQTFRPEFQNRLDKVIVFKPLTRELMRSILKKELDRVFERRGLKDRDWAVEWDASALEFLLEKGFSSEMGARPLKRAIDQYLIAPLAAVIVERRFPEGDQFVFVRRDGNGLTAQFVDPDSDGEEVASATMASVASPGAPTDLFAMMRSPQGTPEEAAALAAYLQPITNRFHGSEWRTAKADLSGRISAEGFWSDSGRFRTLARLELMDRIEVAAETAQSLEHRLSRGRSSGGKVVRDLIARLAMQVHLVTQGLQDLDEELAAEVAVAIEPVFDSPGVEGEAEHQWCREVHAMYRGWARARNMALSELTGLSGVEGSALLISGFGAYRTLAREAGLHILEGVDAKETTSRMTARVLLVTIPPGDLSKAAMRRYLADEFAKVARANTIVRRYRRGSAPLVRAGDGSWRSGRLEEVLRGDFDIMAAI